jgi:hypothetical protein
MRSFSIIPIEFGHFFLHETLLLEIVNVLSIAIAANCNEENQ